jgi:pimeloyl-ACP methyl ester carboxylesterase
MSSETIMVFSLLTYIIYIRLISNNFMIYILHGWNGSQAEYEPIKKYLTENGFTVKGFSYPEKWGTVPLMRLAEKFKVFVESTKNEKETIIIGLSQGGIIASLAIERLGLKCSKCFTICSPWHGSLMACMLPFQKQLPGVWDLRPDSKVLADLRKKQKLTKCIYYAVWNPLDLMVFPGKNAFNECAKNLKVYALLHPLTFWSKTTLEFIRLHI